MYDQFRSNIVLVYESSYEIPVTEFRTKLTKVLSKYMIPNKYIKIDRIPITASGKIDRVSLKRFISQ